MVRGPIGGGCVSRNLSSRVSGRTPHPKGTGSSRGDVVTTSHALAGRLATRAGTVDGEMVVPPAPDGGVSPGNGRVMDLAFDSPAGVVLGANVPVRK